MAIFQMSLSASLFILTVIIIRTAAVNALPKRTFKIFWGIVLFRLLGQRHPAFNSAVYNRPLIAESILLPEKSSGLNGTPAAFLPFAILIWIAGIILCAAFFFITHMRCRREYKTALPIDNDYLKYWQQTHPLKRRVCLKQSDNVQLNYVLTQEFVHIRRFDTLSKVFLAAALCLHWFNPLVWVTFFLANRDMELSCDEAVVRSLGVAEKYTYALALIIWRKRKAA